MERALNKKSERKDQQFTLSSLVLDVQAFTSRLMPVLFGVVKVQLLIDTG